jgi:hypothetical protein
VLLPPLKGLENHWTREGTRGSTIEPERELPMMSLISFRLCDLGQPPRNYAGHASRTDCSSCSCRAFTQGA